MIQETKKVNSIEYEMLEKAKLDQQHFSYFYNKYYEVVFRFIYQRIEQKDTAVDITQQTFIKALNKIHQFEFRGYAFSSWLIRIALNEVNQYYRKHKKHRVININDSIENQFFQSIEADDLEYNKEHLYSSLKLLSKEEFSLIEMRFFDNMPFAVIGTILEITENNAKVKTYRIIKKLKSIFLARLES